MIGMLLLCATAVSTADTETLKSRGKMTSIITQGLVKVGDTVDVNTVYAPVVQCNLTGTKELSPAAAIKDCSNRRVGWLKF